MPGLSFLLKQQKGKCWMPGEHLTSIVPGVQFRGLSFSARNHIFRCMQVRHLGAIEVQHGGPFALAIVAPDDAATQKVSDRARRQIAMEIEETGVQGLVACTQVKHQVGRIVFG